MNQTIDLTAAGPRNAILIAGQALIRFRSTYCMMPPLR
jgi:hypothetical protein